MSIIVPNPHPLKTSPGFHSWLQRQGQEYQVFVDESFLQFFEFGGTGYFCHGAFGVPTGEYAAVKVAIGPIFDRYRELLVPELKEFKHTEFKRIPFDDRWSLAHWLEEILKGHGCFVSAFYTPAKSFLLERIRVSILDTLDALPADHAELLREKATAIRTAWTGPGMSDILSDLLSTAVAGWLHFAAGVDLRLNIVLDPRHPKEDQAVREAIFKIIEHTVILEPRTADRLLGVDITKKSEDEIGLQIADLVAGESRAFLDVNRELLEFGASPKLITPDSHEAIEAWDEFHGRSFKVGAVTRLPNALKNRFSRKDPKGRSVFPCFAELLASGMMTCISTWGTPRHIMPFDGLLFDQLD